MRKIKILLALAFGVVTLSSCDGVTYFVDYPPMQYQVPLGSDGVPLP